MVAIPSTRDCKVRKQKRKMQRSKDKGITFVILSDHNNYRDFVYLCDKALKIETVI